LYFQDTFSVYGARIKIPNSTREQDLPITNSDYFRNSISVINRIVRSAGALVARQTISQQKVVAKALCFGSELFNGSHETLNSWMFLM
jgi:hypothetical protein